MSAFHDALSEQAGHCSRLGSPFMARLMGLLADRLESDTVVGNRCHNWPGDIGPSGQSLPLRLAGALHGLVLDGSDPALAAQYPPHETSSDNDLWTAVSAALHRHEGRILNCLDHAPQTNEVRRAAVIIAGIWWGLGRLGARDVTLSELGASGGLNLSLDRFGVLLNERVYGDAGSPVQLAPDWSGSIPRPERIRVVDRAGVDLNPLPPRQGDNALRLLSYIWPDQPDRLARTRAAIDLACARVDRGEAGEWLVQRLEDPWEGLHVVFSTIAAQYFPLSTIEQIEHSLRKAGRKTTPETPLLHLAMESDGAPQGAALTARLWQGDRTEALELARVSPHGDWINWHVS